MKSIISRSFLLPVFAVAVVFCVSSRGLGQVASVVPPCSTQTGQNFIINYYVFTQEDTIIAITNLSNNIGYQLTPISGDTDVFQRMIEAPPAPFGFNPGDVLDLPLHVSFPCPLSKDRYTAIYQFEGIPCLVDTFTINVLNWSAAIFQPTFLSPKFQNLIPGEEDSQMFYLNNTTADTFQITQIIINDDPRSEVQWSLKDTTRLPINIAPGVTWSIKLFALIPLGDTMPLSGSMEIMMQTECGQTDTVVFHLNGSAAASGQASVTDASSQSASFAINPNPSDGEVTISFPSGNNSTVEIYDVLGNLVLRKVAAGEFVWNSDGAASGDYIVRVTERSEGGLSAVSSKRLSIVR
jgi:hypothetical protein